MDDDGRHPIATGLKLRLSVDLKYFLLECAHMKYMHFMSDVQRQWYLCYVRFHEIKN